MHYRDMQMRKYGIRCRAIKGLTRDCKQSSKDYQRNYVNLFATSD